MSKTSSRKWPLTLDNRLQKRRTSKLVCLLFWCGFVKTRVDVTYSWCCLPYLCAVKPLRRNLSLISHILRQKNTWLDKGSISSRFVSPRSLPHTMAGSLPNNCSIGSATAKPARIEQDFGCDWLILSLVYPTWRKTVLMSFLLVWSVF